MRELKFRVWDNVDYMSTPFTLRDLQEGKIQFTSECQVTQFTGLMDNNKKEIYQLDIVKIKSKASGIEYVRMIVWHQQSCQYKISNSKKRLKGTTALYAEKIYNDNIIVIGNVFENPELIEQMKTITKEGETN